MELFSIVFLANPIHWKVNVGVSLGSRVGTLLVTSFCLFSDLVTREGVLFLLSLFRRSGSCAVLGIPAGQFVDLGACFPRKLRAMKGTGYDANIWVFPCAVWGGANGAGRRSSQGLGERRLTPPLVQKQGL